jgi:hypothetical protein
MRRKPTLTEIELPPVELEVTPPDPLKTDDLNLPSTHSVPPSNPQDAVRFPLTDRIGFAVRTLFRGKPDRAVLILTGATDPTADEVRPTMFEGLKDWKTTILGVITAALALLAKFGIDPGITPGAMETIATAGAVVAGVVLVFINRGKKDGE